MGSCFSSDTPSASNSERASRADGGFSNSSNHMLRPPFSASSSSSGSTHRANPETAFSSSSSLQPPPPLILDVVPSATPSAPQQQQEHLDVRPAASPSTATATSTNTTAETASFPVAAPLQPGVVRSDSLRQPPEQQPDTPPVSPSMPPLCDSQLCSTRSDDSVCDGGSGSGSGSGRDGGSFHPIMSDPERTPRCCGSRSNSSGGGNNNNKKLTKPPHVCSTSGEDDEATPLCDVSAEFQPQNQRDDDVGADPGESVSWSDTGSEVSRFAGPHNSQESLGGLSFSSDAGDHDGSSGVVKAQGVPGLLLHQLPHHPHDHHHVGGKNDDDPDEEGEALDEYW